MSEYTIKTVHSKAYRNFYIFIRSITGFLLKTIYRVEIKGLEKVPSKGGVILCSNHQSYIDPVFIGLLFPRYIYFMAKAELFKHRALAAIITFFNAFPVSRGAFDRDAIRISIKILEAGEIVGIFPEGTRATDGNIKEGQKGIGLISVLSKSPIIPVAISGSNMIIQKPRKRLYFPKVKIAYGEMIDTLEIIKEYGSKNATGIIVEQTMASIKKLYNSIKI